ncbi:MAG TPA: GAF and ANTAR domain-containing protein [Acidimicrobiia bacterium]|jgi:GAF domain-containing protein
MAEYPDGFAELLVALNQSMVSEESLHDTLARVAYIACQSPVGADNAGVTLQRGDGPTTAAFYGDAALPLDTAQYEADDGPCLAAYRTGEIVRLETIAEHNEQWPHFAEAAAQHGIVSSLSLPMRLDSETVGAMNLYSSTPLVLSEADVDLARLFAEQAAVAVSNAEVYWKTYALTQNLMAALESRELIGEAKGIIATTDKVTLDHAFDSLRRRSQQLNMKLRDVAQHVADTGELPDAGSR